MNMHIDFRKNKGITPAMFESVEWLKPVGFVIPLYQRLFVWEEEQVERLLHDLWTAFKADPSKPYHIGILTVQTPNGNDAKNMWTLVDGQQRMTVLTLLGIAFADCYATAAKWRAFLQKSVHDEQSRLKFFARYADQEDIKRLINKGASESVSNPNFRRFFETFRRFQNELGKTWSESKEEFSLFVFEKTTALVSLLPDTFQVNDLNLYFERMNNAGRQLEPHEILKVRYFGDHSRCWNAALDGSSKFEDATEGDSDPTSPDTLEAILGAGEDAFKPEPNSEEAVPSSDRLVLTIPMFLLHVLHTHIGKDRSEAISRFWDANRLLETFRAAKSEDNDVAWGEKFVTSMKKYRKWLDEWIIHLEGDDAVLPWNYKSEGDEPSLTDRCLLNFQAMLRVSSVDRHPWVLEAYEKLGNSDLKPEKLLETLKCQDNARHPFPAVSWSYPTIDRYWFWKLDYILWEQCDSGKPIAPSDQSIEPREIKAVRAYKFRRNRSIEHLRPQNPQESPPEDWKDTLDSFGNLAMISPSFNSAQGNDWVGTKFGRMTDRIDTGGGIESIKLLLMFVAASGKEVGWTIGAARQHEFEMKKKLEAYYQHANLI